MKHRKQFFQHGLVIKILSHEKEYLKNYHYWFYKPGKLSPRNDLKSVAKFTSMKDWPGYLISALGPVLSLKKLLFRFVDVPVVLQTPGQLGPVHKVARSPLSLLTVMPAVVSGYICSHIIFKFCLSIPSEL